jgi:hypothetical protein
MFQAPIGRFLFYRNVGAGLQHPPMRQSAFDIRHQIVSRKPQHNLLKFHQAIPIMGNLKVTSLKTFYSYQKHNISTKPALVLIFISCFFIP